MQHGEFTDYYKLLGIAPTANTLQIRRAFIQKAKQHHPDVGGSTDAMRLLNLAYKTLTSSTAKAAYDLLHRFHTGKKEVEYGGVEFGARTSKKVTDLSDEYVDWFIDSIYVEYSNARKPKLTFGKFVKKLFNT